MRSCACPDDWPEDEHADECPRVADCVFCDIVNGITTATVVREWDDAICIVPLNPVVSGHVLVIPKRHVQTVFSDPEVSAATMRRAAEMLHGVERWMEPRDHITSAGRSATQTVMHLHLHLVPREHGDGLPLPWTPQQEAREMPERGSKAEAATWLPIVVEVHADRLEQFVDSLRQRASYAREKATEAP